MTRKTWPALAVLSLFLFPVHAATISGGGGQSLQVASDGTVRSWGSNFGGQLGDGTVFPHAIEELVPGLTSFTAVSACGTFSMALKSDGTVWSWGPNGAGNLGDGTTTLRLSPVQVSNLTGITAIACGQAHALALKSDGTLWAWGSNSNGQLGNGDGTFANQSLPVQVSVLTNTVVAIGAGDNHSLAVKNDGTAWAWGLNANGQLGIGNLTSQNTPMQVSTLTSVSAVAGGTQHSLALKTNGTVWAWGNNGSGQLGTGNNTQQTTPVQVTVSPGVFLTGITQIDAGGNFSITLKNDGTVWTWGNNSLGQLGDGTTVIVRQAAVQVVGLTNVLEVAAGAQYSLALIAGDLVRGWGFGGLGSLGNGDYSAEPQPQLVPGVSGITSISAGSGHSLARKSDGTAWGWGADAFGQLGFPAGTVFVDPTQIPGITNVQDVAAGVNHSLLLKSDGTVWGLGNNGNGQLGNGDTTNRFTPTQVSTITGITAVAGGGSHSLALKNDGTVWAFGNNAFGQLGTGDMVQHTTPVQVAGLTSVSAIACGSNFSMALKNDGTVWGWGALATNVLTPVQAPGLTGVVAISSGSGAGHVLALKSDGTLWAFGINNTGQLGIGNTTALTTVVQVLGLAGVVSMAAGQNHSMAVTSDGVVWAWGLNSSFQLGTLSNQESDRPVRVAFLTGLIATKVSAFSHSLVLLNDGTVMAWGLNNNHQIGYDRISINPNFENTYPLGIADLKLTKTHSGQFIVGRTGVYTITVTNVGGATMPGPVTVLDLLPTGMTYVSGSGTGWNCVLSNGVIGCTNPADIAASASSSFNITVKIGAAAFPAVTNVTGFENTDLNGLNDFTGDPTLIAPLPGGVTPAGGSGLTQTFSFSFNAANGYQSIGLVDVLINSALTGVSGCYVAFIPSGPTSGNVYLVNDVGSSGGPYTSVALPGAGAAANSQCTINGTGSSVSTTGNTMTVSLNITFAATFAGDKIMYMAVQDTTPVNSGWHALGTWNVPGPPPVGPGVNPPVPARSTTSTQTFTFTFTDTAGFADITITDILINDALTGVAACYAAILPAGPTAATVALVGDAGSSGGPYTFLSVPSAGSAANSQCTINGAGSSINGVGNNLTVTLNITFSPTFSGDHIIFAATRTGALNTGWKSIGTATVP